MFQSIKFSYHNSASGIFKYELIDSEFTCLIESFKTQNKLAPGLIKEYESRKLNIIENLFLLNLCMIKRDWYYDMNQVLEHQCDYFNTDFPELEFNEKYYDYLVKYTKKMLTLA